MKNKITRPSTSINLGMNQHRGNWNSSTKLMTKSTTIKSLPGIKKTLNDFKRKPFRARTVPLSHYEEPFHPILKKRKGYETLNELNENTTMDQDQVEKMISEQPACSEKLLDTIRV
jgi:hypothetical protein